MFSVPVMADSAIYLFQTEKHQIKIQCLGEMPSVFSDSCTYQAWNRPKKVDQGDPDLEIFNGTANIEDFMPVKGIRCHRRSFIFEVDSHTTIHINHDYSNSQTCYERQPGTDGNLTVHIDGKPKSHDRLYEVK